MKKTLTEEAKRIFEIMSQIDKSFILNEDWKTVTNDAGEPIGSENEPDSFDSDDYMNDDREINQKHGIGNFHNIDWQVVHEQLIINSELLANHKMSDGRLMVANEGDFTDDEGMLTPEELQHLEDWGLIYIHDHIPIIEDDTPYLRGNEPMSENIK
jgi:hypothetical protein